MIRSTNEHTTPCALCGELSYFREVDITTETASRGTRVGYTTHARSLTDPEHIAALERAEAFFRRQHAIERAFLDLTEEARLLSYGVMTELSFQPVRPEACDVRQECVPIVAFRFDDVEREVRLARRPLDAVTLDAVLIEARERIEPRLVEMRARRARGLRP